MKTFFKESELTGRKIRDGILLKSVCGEKTQMTFFDFEQGAVIPSHRHPHEQITYILSGQMEFTLEGEKRLLKAGEGVVIPPEKEHGAVITGGPAKALDAWYPIREDYR